MCAKVPRGKQELRDFFLKKEKVLRTIAHT